jgi:hypothetical protein
MVMVAVCVCMHAGELYREWPVKMAQVGSAEPQELYFHKNTGNEEVRRAWQGCVCVWGCLLH